MEFLWERGISGREACRFVRKKVFVEEQGFSEALEFDDTDLSAWHLLVTEKERPIAAARLYEEGNEFHAGRICVLKKYRGAGLGGKILAELERKAAALSANELVLSAQCRARGFYEKSGYTAVGTPFFDEYCPHIKMVKALSSAP